MKDTALCKFSRRHIREHLSSQFSSCQEYFGYIYNTCAENLPLYLISQRESLPDIGDPGALVERGAPDRIPGIRMAIKEDITMVGRAMVATGTAAAYSGMKYLSPGTVWELFLLYAADRTSLGLPLASFTTFWRCWTTVWHKKN